MWRIGWRCFNHGYEIVKYDEVLNRSPYSGGVKAYRCMFCGEAMVMSFVEDLRPKSKPARTVRKRSGGFKAVQLELF